MYISSLTSFPINRNYSIGPSLDPALRLRCGLRRLSGAVVRVVPPAPAPAGNAGAPPSTTFARRRGQVCPNAKTVTKNLLCFSKIWKSNLRINLKIINWYLSYNSRNLTIYISVCSCLGQIISRAHLGNRFTSVADEFEWMLVFGLERERESCC